MNLRIKLAYFSIVLSSAAILNAFRFEGDMRFALFFFAVGCFVYSYLALYIFRKEEAQSSQKTFLFLGGLIAETIVLTIHIALFVSIAIEYPGPLAYMYDTRLFGLYGTSFAVIPAVGIGLVVGGVLDILSDKRQGIETPRYERNIFKSIKVWVIRGLAFSLVLAVLVSAYWYLYMLNFAAGSQGRMLDARAALFLENLIRYLVSFSLLFVPIGVFAGVIAGIAKDKKSVN